MYTRTKMRRRTFEPYQAVVVHMGEDSCDVAAIIAVHVRIMWIDTHDTRGRTFGVSLQDFEDWRRTSRSFAGMTLVQSGSLSISGDDRVPESYPGGYISANAFDLVGIQPIVGRGFQPA